MLCDEVTAYNDDNDDIVTHITFAGVYISENCKPTYSERFLFDYMVHQRKTVTIREAAIELFGQADVQLFGSDKNFVSVLKVTSPEN